MILCCGEALIDMIPTECISGETGFVPHAGGAVFNTAIGLGRLNIPTGFLSGISSDLFGDRLRHALDASQVNASFTINSDRPTTLAFVHLTDGKATYTFYDENSAGRELHADALPNVPKIATAMYFGGISLINEPCAEFYVCLAEREAVQKVIIADPNIRPEFIQDEQNYRIRLSRLIKVADIVKVSDEDLDWIIPGSASLESKATKLQDQGPHIVILTRGSEGASALMSNDSWIKVSSEEVDVVDTVGAGDTFNSGLLAKLYKKGFL